MFVTYPIANTVLLILHPYAPLVLFAVTVLTGSLVFMTSKGRYNTRMDKLSISVETQIMEYITEGIHGRLRSQVDEYSLPWMIFVPMRFFCSHPSSFMFTRTDLIIS